jgi:monoamine oxidase
MTMSISNCDVAIVGAGVAGLVAAHILSRAGRTVKCFEARDRVGGRASTIERSSVTIDLGATWFWPNEPLVRSVLDDLRLGSFSQATRGDVIFEGGEEPPQRLGGNPIDVPSYRFRAGAQSLATGLAEQLEGGSVNLCDPVHRVRTDGHRVLVEASSGTHVAEHVIVALPPALAIEAITFSPEIPAPIRRIASETAVWMGDIVKAVAVYEVPFWRADDLAGTAISYRGPFREFHDHSGPDDGPGAIFGFASGTALGNATESDIAESFRTQLIRLFGERATRPLDVLVTNWLREKYTTPARPSLHASTEHFGHPLFQGPTGNGRIHWASTETASAYAGHIEGAIRAGTDAARNVEHRFGS